MEDAKMKKEINNLIIVGAGGFGREVAWLVERINRVEPTWNLLGFIDDNESILNSSINGYPVLGSKKVVSDYPDSYYVLAVGNSRTREKIVSNLKEIYSEIKFGTLIDPSVEVSDFVTVGEGSIICAHTIMTVNISIGVHVIINLDCTIGHDAVIKDYSTLYPSVNVSGISCIGHATELGTGMQIIQGKRIGDYSIVGAGSVVVSDIPDRCTAVGCPAKPIKYDNL